MTKFEIQNRFTGKVQFVAEIDCVWAAYSRAYKMRFAVQWAMRNNINLREADLSGGNLAGVDLSYADLSYADLRNADLSYADLRNADLTGVDLNGVDLSNTKLTEFHAAVG